VNGKSGGGEAGMQAVDRVAEVLLDAPLATAACATALGGLTALDGLKAQEGCVTPTGARTNARITESMYSDGSVVPSRRRRSITPGPQL